LRRCCNGEGDSEERGNVDVLPGDNGAWVERFDTKKFFVCGYNSLRFEGREA